MTLDALIARLQELRDGPLAGRFEVRYVGHIDDYDIESLERDDRYHQITLSPASTPPMTGMR